MLFSLTLAVNNKNRSRIKFTLSFSLDATRCTIRMETCKIILDILIWTIAMKNGRLRDVIKLNVIYNSSEKPS